MTPRFTPRLFAPASPAPARRLVPLGALLLVVCGAYNRTWNAPPPAGQALLLTLSSRTAHVHAAPAALIATRPKPLALSAKLEPGSSVVAPLDPATAFTALDAIQDSPASYLFDRYTELLTPFLSAGNFAAALELVTTTPRADVRRLLVAALCDVWGRVSPADAAPWLASQPEFADRTRLMADILTSWSARDPGSALAFAIALPPGNDRNAALASAVQQWAIRDPAGAGAWAAANAIELGNPRRAEADPDGSR